MRGSTTHTAAMSAESQLLALSPIDGRYAG
jgi:hypothetical protein